MLLTQEVSDFQNSALLNNVTVNGEMCVDCSHDVSESFADAADHVIDMGLARVDGGGKFRESNPFSDDDGVLSLNFLLRDLNF